MRKRERPIEDDMETSDFIKRSKHLHTRLFPQINLYNFQELVRCTFLPVTDPLLNGPGFILVTVDQVNYVFPVSVLLDPDNYTMSPNPNTIITLWNDIEQTTEFAYFNPRGRQIVCHPDEEQLVATKQSILQEIYQPRPVDNMERGILFNDAPTFKKPVLCMRVELRVALGKVVNHVYLPLSSFSDRTLWPNSTEKVCYPFRMPIL